MRDVKYWKQVSIPSVMLIAYALVSILLFYLVDKSENNSNMFSMIAAGASALAAWLTYTYNVEKDNQKDGKDFLFVIVQLAALYNKVHGLYFNLGQKSQNTFSSIIDINREKVFDESNKSYYNNSFHIKFINDFIDLMAIMAFWKGTKIKDSTTLVADYCNAVQILKICNKIIVDVYTNKGYGAELVYNVTKDTLLTIKDSEDSTVALDARSMELQKNYSIFEGINYSLRNQYGISNELNKVYKDNYCKEKVLRLLTEQFICDVINKKINFDEPLYIVEMQCEARRYNVEEDTSLNELYNKAVYNTRVMYVLQHVN